MDSYSDGVRFGLAATILSGINATALTSYHVLRIGTPKKVVKHLTNIISNEDAVY
jgi:hypothetical protein